MRNKLIFNIIFILAFHSFFSKSFAQIKILDNFDSINFETNFTLINEFIIDTTEVPIGTPDAAFDNDNFLVVWEKWPGSISRVVGARIATNGQILDMQPFEIASSCYRANPSISFDNKNYLVVWGAYSSPNDVSIYASRVQPSGQVIDSKGIKISPAQWFLNSTDIIFGADQYYVVWTHWLSAFSRNVHGTPVTSSGSVRYLGGLPIGVTKDWSYDPSVSFDGQNYFVVCYGMSQLIEKANYIYGARVNNDGIVIDVSALKIYTSSIQNPMGAPHIAFGNGVYLVVWSEDRNVGSGFDIFGSRVTPNGQVLDINGIPISNAIDDQQRPLAEFDGKNFIVVWSDKRNGGNYDVYCTQVTSEGVVLNSDGFELIDADYDREISSICKGTSDQILLVGSGQFDAYSKTKVFGAIYHSGNVSIQIEANFIGTPVSGIKPLAVNFLNQSTGSITSYSWDFGDGQKSNEQNPTHTYNSADTFTVSLTVSGPGGSDTKNRVNYIIVNEPTHIENLTDAVQFEYKLYQNYPNPFNPTTMISYLLPIPNHVRLQVVDLRGRILKTIVDEFQQRGEYSLIFRKENLPSGVYLVRLLAGNFVETKKMVILQ